MPYPNFHSCRLIEPSECEPNSFRTMKKEDVEIIIAKKKGEKTTTAQAIRYPTDKWDEKEAEGNCKKRGGKFEKAKE